MKVFPFSSGNFKCLKEEFIVRTLTSPSLQGWEPHCPALKWQIILGEEVKKKLRNVTLLINFAGTHWMVGKSWKRVLYPKAWMESKKEESGPRQSLLPAYNLELSLKVI